MEYHAGDITQENFVQLLHKKHWICEIVINI